MKRKPDTGPFMVHEDVIMHSPFTDDDTVVNYRGCVGDQAVVWTGRMQLMVPLDWLREKDIPNDETTDK